MKTIASILFLCLFLHAAAQRECATQAYNSTYSSMAKGAAPASLDIFALQNQTQHFISGTSGSEAITNRRNIIRIPVVVHVLYNTPAQNISDAQIQSGIASLNRDFRRQNWDTVNTPARFKSIAADVEIEFHLATADPKGVATTGIIRRQTAVPAFGMDDKIKFSAQGGADAWDTKSYLNIWLGNTRRLLGYGTMPGGDDKVDGLVINITAFGTIKTAAPYNMGRTAVHEAGHWLGLQHLWGDESCGDDGVEDTPKQGGYTSGCPSGFRSSCSNGTAGDMYMNYMDFTNDACMNLFTYGQKARMLALFEKGGLRSSFLNSTGLHEPWVEEAPAMKEETPPQHPVVHIFPNPAQQEVTLQFNELEEGVMGTLYLVNTYGTRIQEIKITNHKQKISLTQLKPGIYFLEGIVNGTKIHHKLVKL